MKSLLLLSGMLVLSGCAKEDAVVVDARIYPPNIAIWPNGEYLILDSGTERLHGNILLLPPGDYEWHFYQNVETKP